MEKRNRFVSSTETTTGIRIEYTVSSRYTQKRVGKDEWKFICNNDHSEIIHTSSKYAEISGLHTDLNGFPRIDLRSASGIVMANVMSQDSTIVRGCPTTIVVENGSLMINGHPNQYYMLLIRPEMQTIVYFVQVSGLHTDGINPDLTELRRIRDSIRVINTKKLSTKFV